MGHSGEYFELDKRQTKHVVDEEDDDDDDLIFDAPEMNGVVPIQTPAHPQDRGLESDLTPSLISSTDTALVFRLFSQALPPLILSVAGLLFVGEVLDTVQHWDSYEKISELFILVPILLNLKGNLEMNLASRFSTSANMGELDIRKTRRALVIGNLALLQVQALIVGALAGFVSFVLGYIIEPHKESYFESMLMIASSMLCASASSLLLGTFMCAMVILSRRFRLDPDNMATPLAASLGDIIALIMLSLIGTVFVSHLNSALSTIIFITLIIATPMCIYIVHKNAYVNELLLQGWTPILLAMIISSVTGLVLERNIDEYAGLALLVPVMNGLSGNVGAIFASRISTALHASKAEPYKITSIALFCTYIPAQCLFLFFLWITGGLKFGILFFIIYLLVSGMTASISLFLAKFISLWLWKRQYDPDNYTLPLLSSIVDVIGTTALTLTFMIMTMLSIAPTVPDSEGNNTPLGNSTITM